MISQNSKIVSDDSKVVYTSNRESILALFSTLDVTYSSKLMVPDDKATAFKKISKYFYEQYYSKNDCWDLVSSHILKSGGSLLMEGKTAELAIATVPELGLGVFAARDIPRGFPIGEYTGVLRFGPGNSTPYCALLFNDEPNAGNAGRTVVSALNFGNETRFINHLNKNARFILPNDRWSIGPNVEFIPLYYNDSFHIVVHTLRDISAGEELRLDYGIGYFRAPTAPKELDKLYFLENNGVVRELVKD